MAIGAIGYIIWSAQQANSTPTRESARKTTPAAPTVKQQELAPPSGYTLFVSQSDNISFYYPDYWGSTTVKQSTSLFEAETIDAPITNVDNLQMTIWTDTIDNFVTRSSNRNVTLYAVEEKDDYVWKYAQSVYGLQQGAIAEQQPELVRDSGNAQIYKISGGHACGAETQYIIATGKTFLGIIVNYSACYSLQDQNSPEQTAQFEQSINRLKSEIDALPQSIKAATP